MSDLTPWEQLPWSLRIQPKWFGEQDDHEERRFASLAAVHAYLQVTGTIISGRDVEIVRRHSYRHAGTFYFLPTTDD